MESEHEMKARHEREIRESERRFHRERRQAENCRRIRWAARNLRLWMRCGERWENMTDKPLQWFINKRMGTPVARVRMERGK